MKQILLIGVFLMSSCSKPVIPPKATKKPYSMITHNDTRIDNYYWMRLTDTQKPYHTSKMDIITILDTKKIKNMLSIVAKKVL